MNGIIYLLHFVDEKGESARFHHAAHYLGWTMNLDQRLRQHRSGGTHQSPLLRAVLDSGLDFVLVRTWEDVDRNFERRLKNRGSLLRVCPVCRGEVGLQAA